MPSELASDLELVRKLGFSDSFLSKLLGKTRQAVNRGLKGNKQAIYLKDHEMAKIFEHCKSHQLSVVPEIENYIRKTRPRDSVVNIISADGAFLSEETLLRAQNVFIVVPDYRFFRKSYASAVSMLLKRITARPEGVTIITVDRGDADYLARDLRAHDPSEQEQTVRILTDGKANSFPQSIFLTEENSIGLDCWVWGPRGFYQIDATRGEAMARFLFEDLPQVGSFKSNIAKVAS